MIHNVGPKRVNNSISSAYNCASDGDILLIDEGNYYENIDINNKSISLVGNTLNPGNGRVFIEIYDTIRFRNINKKPINIENIHLSIGNNMIVIEDCVGLSMIFNSCIINNMYERSCIFNINSSNGGYIFSKNSTFIWNPDYEYNINGASHFIYDNSDTNFEFVKCILSQELESIYQLRFGNTFKLDYVTNFNTVGYGPFYGEYSGIIPKQYYFKGHVYNSSNEFSRVGNITFDSYYKAPEINLSDSELFASVDYNSSTNSNYYGIRATVGRNSGKWYWEIRRKDLIYNNLSRYGVGTSVADFYKPLGGDSRSWGYELSSGKFYYDNEVFYTSETCGYGDIIGIALDSYNGKIWFSKNGSWLLGGDPSKGKNPIFSGLNYTVFPMVSLYPSYGYDSIAEIIFSTGPDVVDTPLIEVTWDFYNKGTNIVLTNGYMTAHSSGGYCTVLSSSGFSSGKYYWEVLIDIYNSPEYDHSVGVATIDSSLSNKLGSDSYGWAYLGDGSKYHNNQEEPYGNNTGYVDSTIGVALDMDNKKIWFSINGAWQGGGDPSNGSGEAYGGLYGTVYAAFSTNGSYPKGTITFDETNWSYPAPEGFEEVKGSDHYLNYPIPDGFEFYSTSFPYKVKCINAVTNEVTGYTHSDPITNEYELITTSSGSHFLICEDNESLPDFNDLLLGRFKPKEVLF